MVINKFSSKSNGNTENITSKNLYDLVKIKLFEFGISIEQVFTVTTDNGKNLIKLSKLLQKDQFDSEECERANDEESNDDDDDEVHENNDIFGNDETRNSCPNKTNKM